ncbi:MAG: hypothetical protein L3I99_05615 [Sulfurimonas sp.]|nr:hypothetical protein [Sulfurimonas sp.]
MTNDAKIKEFAKWLQAGKKKTWTKTHSDSEWQLLEPDWFSNYNYITNNRHAELRKMKVDKPETVIEAEILPNLWRVGLDPTWYIDVNYRFKKEETEYPLFKKMKNQNTIVEFKELHKGRVVFTDKKWKIEQSSMIWSKYFNTDTWEDVPYDKESELFHGQVVWAWDENWSHNRCITYYDAINKCAFSENGKQSLMIYDNYKPIPLEQIPEFMLDGYFSLEGIK